MHTGLSRAALPFSLPTPSTEPRNRTWRNHSFGGCYYPCSAPRVGPLLTGRQGTKRPVRYVKREFANWHLEYLVLSLSTGPGTRTQTTLISVAPGGDPGDVYRAAFGQRSRLYRGVWTNTLLA
jgi:hypothetical protein